MREKCFTGEFSRTDVRRKVFLLPKDLPIRNHPEELQAGL